jgi:hypothetical protein
MATTKQLEQQVKALKVAMAAAGIPLPGEMPDSMRPEDRDDYIEFGSDEHAQFLGLVKVSEGDDTADYQTLTSPETGQTWRLLDEMEAVRHFPGIDPEKAARLLLRQKVNTLETRPEVPPDAPAPFRP